MNNVNDEYSFFKKLLTMLEQHFGSNCEIVLHDLTRPYESTIIDIRNGHVTGRKIGDCGSNLGLEVLKGTVKNGDKYNYITLAKDKIIRSSSMYIKNHCGKVIGALCINTDITESVKFENYLKQYNNYNIDEETKNVQSGKEIFASDVQELLDYLIIEAQQVVGKPVTIMNKDEKVQFIKCLDDKGAFLITKSSEKICALLGISKFTFYKYLDEARNGAENSNCLREIN